MHNCTLHHVAIMKSDTGPENRQAGIIHTIIITILLMESIHNITQFQFLTLFQRGRFFEKLQN